MLFRMWDKERGQKKRKLRKACGLWSGALAQETTLYRKLKEYGIDVTSISGKGPGADEEGETTPFNRAASWLNSA